MYRRIRRLRQFRLSAEFDQGEGEGEHRDAHEATKGFTPRNAMHAVWAVDFDPEAASADDVLVSRLLNWGETSARSPRTGSSTPTSCSTGCG